MFEVLEAISDPELSGSGRKTSGIYPIFRTSVVPLKICLGPVWHRDSSAMLSTKTTSLKSLTLDKSCLVSLLKCNPINGEYSRRQKQQHRSGVGIGIHFIKRQTRFICEFITRHFCTCSLCLSLIAVVVFCRQVNSLGRKPFLWHSLDEFRESSPGTDRHLLWSPQGSLVGQPDQPLVWSLTWLYSVSHFPFFHFF